MARVYISYRVQDSNIVKRIIRRCLQSCGIYSVIMNPEATCPADSTLIQHIDNLMFGVDTILLIVGKDWAGLDEFGRFKLSSADTPVSEEVQVALRSKKQVILVLVNGADLPVPDIIPENLQGIFRLPIAPLRAATFTQDLNRLIPPAAFADWLFYYLSCVWLRRYIRTEEDADY
jgi:TIR domain